MANILYVDDDRDTADLVEKSLTCENHSMTVVYNGPEGWGLLRQNEYDLLILDWEMPDLNGIEILKLLRSRGDTTPVIMMTGRRSVEDKVTGLDAGANDYLTKPFQMDELLARVRAILRSKKAVAPPPKPLGTNNEEVLKKANLSGTTLAARFEFLDVIGEGGAAIVFKAKHPDLDKCLAVKMLQASELTDEMVGRFAREARLASNLDHPNIVIIHDYGITENKQPYIVMELIEGPSLHEFLKERDYLPLKEALPILISASDGIAHAHEHGVLHRDIKPENIMLKPVPKQPPVPKILDFGLAKLLQSNPQKAASAAQGREIVGSPPYMSPEQVQGKSLDERSDIYSFGCVIFEVVTGFAPFCGDDPVEVALKHVEEPPLTFVEARPEVKYPPDLQLLIAKALEVDPSKRFQKMSELHDALSEVLRNLEDTSIWSKLRKLKIFSRA